MRTSRLLAPLAAVLSVGLVVPLGPSAQARPASSTSGPGASSTHHPTAAVARRFGASSPAYLLVRRGSDNAIRFLGTTAGHTLARAQGVSATTPAATAALAFVRGHAGDFGVAGRGSALRTLRSQRAEGGDRIVHLQQTLGGYPVLGGELSVSMTADNRVEAVTAHTLPGLHPLGHAALRPSDARRIALTATARAQRLTPHALHASRATLVVFAPGVLGVPALSDAPRLGYRVVVDGAAPTTSGDPVRELVVVDAQTGAPLIAGNQVAFGAVQRLCTAGRRDAVTNPRCPSPGGVHYPTNMSSSAVTADPDAANARKYAGNTYTFYSRVVGNASKIGVSSGSNRGLYSTVHFCNPDKKTATPCPNWGNAFWDGHEMVYGQHMSAADDVVAHELTHSVTEHTSNLYYWYQSGAINESISDIMGELDDQWNGLGIDGNYPGTHTNVRWMIGENLPTSVGILRDMKDPTRKPAGLPAGTLAHFTRQPDKMTSSLYYSAQTGGFPVPAFPADEGGVHINSGVGNKAAFLIVDGGAAAGHVFNGIAVPPMTGKRVQRLVKAARIYFRVDRMLTSGADYADLFNVLPAACQSLANAHVAGINSTDCSTVSKAVKATEMDKLPVRGAAPDATTCNDPQALYGEWFDNLENTGSGNWAVTPTGGKGPWYYPASHNLYDNAPMVYATSGTHEAWGDDVDPQYWKSRGVTVPTRGWFSMTRDVKVPNGPSTYLTFAQAFQFEWYPGSPPLYTDGGRLEYSTDGGHTWPAVPARWFSSGGYNATVTGLDASATFTRYQFAGFGGDSHGYMTSKLDLTQLAGQNVRIRFHIFNDDAVGATGWFVDDVRFFTCGVPKRVTETPNGPGAVTVTWTKPLGPTNTTTNPITGYRVLVKSGSTIEADKTVTGADTLSEPFTGLPQGMPLTAYVAAVTSTGTGPWRASNVLQGTNLTLAQGSTAGELNGTLTNASATGLSGKTVEIRRTADNVVVASPPTGTDGHFTATGLSSGTSYYATFAGSGPYAGSRSADVLAP